MEKKPIDTIVDGENNRILVDTVVSLSGDNLKQQIIRAIEQNKSPHYFLPLSGKSGGSGVFQVNPPGDGTILGLQIVSAPSPRISLGESPNIIEIGLDQIVIDQPCNHIYAGSSITLDQLNRALSEHLSGSVRVLGSDLTSYTYAQVGATFMTGGMGPQRRYFSDSVNQIGLFDGEEITAIDGDALRSYAGTYGWSGLVTAVRCEYVRLPATEIAFAIPVINSPMGLAKLLQHFSRYTYLQIANGLVHADNGTGIILGLEHVTTQSMEPMFAQGDNGITRRARQLEQNCLAANADGLIFVNGYSDSLSEDFLLSLVDDPDADQLSIAGVDLEHTEVFKDPEQMRTLREAIPFAARTQVPSGKFTYKGHTDANIRLNPNRVEDAMQSLWQSNQRYVRSIEQYFAEHPKVSGQILVYGHLNPYGVDPHNRLTFSSDQQEEFAKAVEFVHDQQTLFLNDLQEICLWSQSKFIGGEKSAGSEYEMFESFGGPNGAPVDLSEKFHLQEAAIRAASPVFNWRAKAPYG